jgi:cellulose synthase/poly-beta-1,6-N-acetylglucosamine synthase-like glycosyltransferase
MGIGSCCAVSGTGFGFTRQLLEEMGGWKFFTLTEDIEFSTWCATRGIRIGYCHDAVLYDEQPTSFSVSVRQRTRWIQGGVQVSFRYARDFLRGMRKGGRTAYATFETATLSLWGYGMGAVSFTVALLTVFLAERWLGLAYALLLALLGSYGSLLITGILTTVSEWKRIHAPAAAKIGYLFTFPLFMLSYVPIALAAPFRKYRWQPIAHTVTLSVEQLHVPESK